MHQTFLQRPRVSDDDPNAEALFRTANYRREIPNLRFTDLNAARIWPSRFVHEYNHEHQHSAGSVRYPGPTPPRAGPRDPRKPPRSLPTHTLERANPLERNDPRLGAVSLNPEKETAIQAASARRMLSSSIGAPALPSQPEKINARVRSERKEGNGATRSHAQRHVRREHRDDGQDRTLAEAQPGILGQVRRNKPPVQPHQSRGRIKEDCYEIRAATHLTSTASTVAHPSWRIRRPPRHCHTLHYVERTIKKPTSGVRNGRRQFCRFVNRFDLKHDH